MEKNEREEKITQYRARIARWQQLSITQLSNTNNLILTFTLAFLSFSVSKIGIKTQENYCCYTAISGYILLLISLLIGTLLTINRLCDFRKTTELVILRKEIFETEDKIKKDEKKKILDSTKAATIELGKITWYLFYCQVLTFLLGFILLLTIIIIQNN